MNKKDSKNLTGWQQFLKNAQIQLQPIANSFEAFNQKYPNVNQIIQLTFIYFFAIVDLNFAILSNVFSLGYFPELLKPIFPLISKLLQSPFLKIWASPEKVFFLSYVTIELAIVRKVFNFSKLVRYNILLIFSLLMIQGLVVSYWDLLFNRTVAAPVVKWVVDAGYIINNDKSIAIFFFLNTFFVFVLVYLYLYITAVRGKYSTLPFMEWLFDSIAFWVKIKTPTMRIGNNNPGNSPKNE
jgi:hypothetical protein